MSSTKLASAWGAACSELEPLLPLPSSLLLLYDVLARLTAACRCFQTTSILIQCVSSPLRAHCALTALCARPRGILLVGLWRLRILGHRSQPDMHQAASSGM
jgi:hypothetical protein